MKATPFAINHDFVIRPRVFDGEWSFFFESVNQRCIAWNNSVIGITWLAGLVPQLSAKDRAGYTLAPVEVFA